MYLVGYVDGGGVIKTKPFHNISRSWTMTSGKRIIPFHFVIISFFCSFLIKSSASRIRCVRSIITYYYYCYLNVFGMRVMLGCYF